MPAMASIALAPERRRSPLEIVRENFYRAAAYLQLPLDLSLLLTTPQRELRTEIPVWTDEGPLQVFPAYRVQHNSTRGACLGRMELFEDFDLERARGLAEHMTWKAALFELPFGGACGGIDCDPARLSEREMDELCSRFAARISNLLGPYRDVLTTAPELPDTVPQRLFAALTERKDFSVTSMTGRAAENGGIAGRAEAIGYGLSVLVQQAAQEIGLDSTQLRVAIVGHSPVTLATASALQRAGAVLVAVTAHQGPAADYTRQTAAEHVMASPCDVLFLADSAVRVYPGNARKVRARLVIEAADLMISPETDLFLHSQGATVIPDLIANGAGALCDHAEWAASLEKKTPKPQKLYAEIEHGMLRTYGSVQEYAAEHRLPLRTAAYVMAVDRVACLEKLRVA